MSAPFQFVARRDARFTATGSVTDQAAVERVLKQFSVPGVSVAVIKDFEVIFARGYGAVIMTKGDNGGAVIAELRRMIQQEYKWDVLDKPIPRRYGPT